MATEAPPSWRKQVRRAVDQEAQAEANVQIVLFGDSGVGKTSLLRAWLDRSVADPSRSPVSTVGVDFLTRNICVGDALVRVLFWDTAGQERYAMFGTAYARQADGFLLVYDVARPETRVNLERWLRTARDAVPERPGRPDPLVAVVGNKIDLPRKVPLEEAREQYERLNFFYFETSASTLAGVADAFDQFAAACYIQSCGGVAGAPRVPADKRTFDLGAAVRAIPETARVVPVRGEPGALRLEAPRQVGQPPPPMPSGGCSC